MKSTSLADHKSALEKLIANSNQAVERLQAKATEARATIAKAGRQWTSESLDAATAAAQELASIEVVIAEIPSLEYRERTLATGYIKAHAEEIQSELKRMIESKSRGRDGFRKSRAAMLAKVTEALTLSEDPNQWRTLGEEQTKLEFEMQHADRLRDNAVSLARHLELEREPTLAQLTGAIAACEQIAF